jgi:hypothetical protein
MEQNKVDIRDPIACNYEQRSLPRIGHNRSIDYRVAAGQVILDGFAA